MSEFTDEVTEIGVGSSYGNGWRQLKRNFWVLLIITIIVLLISSPSEIMGDIAEKSDSGFFGLLALVYGILVTGPIYFGASFVYLKAARDDSPQIMDAFEGFRDYWNVVLANFLVWLIIVVGFLLFIVPGIIFGCKLAFTPFLVVDRKMRAGDAIKESWRLTKGRALTVFLIGLLTIPIAIAGLICLGVGIIVSIMWIGLAFASLYYAVSSSDKGGEPDTSST